MINLGRVRPGSTIYIPFETFASSTGAPITLTGLATSDIQVYKDGGTTQRASASGFTLLDTDGIDFDGITGIHGFSIDLSDNTTADFWASGSKYFVVVSTVTVDSQTMSFIAATFEIGYQGSWLDTTIATLASQTSFTLTSGPAEDDALNGHWAIIHDAASAVQSSRVLISDYTGASKTVTLAAGATFTAAAKDNISVMGMAPMQPATLGRQPVVDASGLVDANTVKVGPTGSGMAQTARDIGASVLLSSGTGTGQLDFTSGVVKADATKVGGQTASASGTVTFPNATLASTTNITAGTITTVTNLTNAPTNGDLTATMKTSVTTACTASTPTAAAVTGAVGSVTGNVGGNVVGSVGSISGISFPSNFAALGINVSGHVSRVTLTDTVTTYTGNTPQTGDSFARIGANGASLSAIPWNAAWDAEVQSEVQDAIEVNQLDHFIQVADPGSIVANDSLLAKLVSKSATAAFSSYVNTTDSLEALRDRGDAAWITATGFSTLDAAGVRTELTTELARIDAAISTRLASASYTAPPSAATNASTLLGTTNGAATVAVQLQHLDADVSSAGGGGAGAGPGADSVTLTITDDGAVPIPDAEVWITTTAASSPVYAGFLLTNAQGEVTFMLNAGDTYYLWMQANGYNSIEGQSFVAVAD